MAKPHQPPPDFPPAPPPSLSPAPMPAPVPGPVPERPLAGTGVRKRSLTIAGHRTSISLEAAFWDALRRLAERRGVSVQALVAEVDRARTDAGAPNLSGALRVVVLEAALAGELGEG